MDLGLPWFSYRASFDPSRAHFRSKNMGFFHENDFFWMCDKSARSADDDMMLKPQFDYFWNFGIKCDFIPKFSKEATWMNFEVRNIIFGAN